MDNMIDLNYLVFSLPSELSKEEKMKRLSIFADKITGVAGGDVICWAMWMPH